MDITMQKKFNVVLANQIYNQRQNIIITIVINQKLEKNTVKICYPGYQTVVLSHKFRGHQED